MTRLLSTQHPRLYVNAEKISKMKEQIKDDPTFRLLSYNLLSRAEGLISETTVEFKITGPRMLKNCQEILSRITTLGLAYHLTNNNKYAARAIEELLAASKYPHWNQAHFLDTAELITAFAIGYDWFFHVMSEIEKQTIKKAMIEKGLQVGLEEHAKNIWWAGHKFNWNQVCNGGLIIGALSIADENPELCNNIFDATVKYLPIAFNSYGRDGGWEGGPDYWAYTTWYSILLVDALLTNTGSDFGLSKTPGFDKTALFPIYNCGTTGKQFNFADADADDVHKAYPTLFWLGSHFKIDAGINENHRLLKISIDNNLPFDAFNLVWYVPPVSNAKPLAVNKLFSGINAGYMRGRWDKRSISLAFKGGYNLADHAHLDLGTFVLDYDGVRWASDLGRDNYDLPDYFQRIVGGGRWRYFRLNTKSHNTLVLNNDNQQVDARAKIVQFDPDNEQPYAVVDLSEAYKAQANSVLRTFKLTGESSVLVSDKVEGNETLQSVQWQMLTDAEVLVSNNKATLLRDGKIMHAKIIQPVNAVFEVVSAEQREPEMFNKGYKLLCSRITKFDDSKCEIIIQFDGHGA
jgi:hypothetical protein